MAMEEALRAQLTANAGLAALVGSRVSWGLRPRGNALPAVALHLIGAGPDYTMDGASGLAQSRVQIDCWALSYADMAAVARAVTAALSGLSFTVEGVVFQGLFLDSGRDLPDEGTPPDEMFFRRSLDFMIWHD